MAIESADLSERIDDLLAALDFAEKQCNRWQAQGLIGENAGRAIARSYDELRSRLKDGGAVPSGLVLPTVLPPVDACWSCRSALDLAEQYCSECGAPVHNAEVDRLRYLVFLCHEVNRHARAGRLPLAASHDCLRDANGRIVALRRRLDRERAPLVEAVASPSSERASEPRHRPARRRRRAESAPDLPQRPLLEILLDPRSLQWLLASGGVLLVLGLVIWLATQGVFQNKVVLAGTLAAGNAVLLLGGWAVIRLTRAQLAGRALTLLACLVMPLNLWFLVAQGLMTLGAGGHLWLPALICVVLYATSARLLRDPVFVYVLVAGVTLTGLLILGDVQLDQFWEISGPATLLVVLGVLCLAAERAFPAEGEGPFTRPVFGLAFFWSGQAVLGAGLLLLLATQVFGGALFEVFEPVYKALGLGRPSIVTNLDSRLLVLALVLVGTAAYIYSDLVVRRIGVYIYLAVFTLLWAEVLVLTLFDWRIPVVEVVIFTLSLTALLANVAIATLGKSRPILRRAGAPLALALSVAPVCLGVFLHFRATVALPEWRYTLHGSYVLAMLVTAISCRIGAFLYRHDSPALSMTYFFGTAGATLVGAAGLLLVLSPRELRWEDQAPLLMLIPLAYLVASRLYRGHTPEVPLVWVAHAATGVMLFSSIGAALRGFVLIEGEMLNLTLALFFLEAVLFYALDALWRDTEGAVYVASAAACAAGWQVLKYFRVPDEYYVLAFATVGVGLLVAYRLALLEKMRFARLGWAAFQGGNALLSLAFVAGALMVLSELLVLGGSRGVLVLLLAILVAFGVLAIVLVRHQGWRRWYLATAIGNTGLLVLVMAILGQLTPWEKLEIASLVVGVCLLVAGHIGWFRERDNQDDMVTLCLLLGSMLVAIPLTVATVACRAVGADFDTFHALNEVGMLAAGLILLASGFMFQLKSTTIHGALLMGVYLATLALFIRFPRQLQSTAVYMMIGGGAFFGIGILLSLYRDRLLALPERIKRREGVFRVLTWR
jgi:hypothetical protein